MYNQFQLLKQIHNEANPKNQKKILVRFNSVLIGFDDLIK